MGLAPYGKPAFMDAMRKIVRLMPDGDFRARSRLFSPSQGADRRISGRTARPNSATCSAPALEDLLGPRRAPDDPLEDRHRDIARSVQAMYEEAFFHLIGRLHERYALDESGARRRLRDELGRQRQGAADDAVPARLRAVGGGRCRRRDRRGLRALAQARRRAVVRDGSRLLGAAIQRGRYRGRCSRRSAAEIDAAGCTVEDDRGRGRALPARPPPRSPTARWSAGSRGAWNGGRARSATARSSATRAAPT